MKLIKHALLGLLLATSAVAASAAVITGTDIAIADATNPGTLQTWSFEFGGAGIKANDTFSYDLLFFPPPSADFTYFALLAYGDGPVSFTGATFTPWFGPAIPGYNLNVGSASVTGNGYIESNGVYDLHLAGTFLADGAAVVGRAADDIGPVSVPEPLSVSLILAGLAGLAGSRRRGAKAIQERAQAA